MLDRRSRPYPTDLSDVEWTALEPLLPRPGLGRPLKWPRRLMAEAIFYLVRSGCGWRMLPRHFPPGPRFTRSSRAGGAMARSGACTTACASWLVRPRCATPSRVPQSWTARRRALLVSAALSAATTRPSAPQVASATSWWMRPGSCCWRMCIRPTFTTGSEPKLSSAAQRLPSSRGLS